MKRLAMILGAIAVVLPFLFKVNRIVEVRLAGSGPDIVYRVLVEGREVAKIRKGESVKLKLGKKERAVEIAVDDITIESESAKPLMVFKLPSLQSPEVHYNFNGTSLVINGITDPGPYPVNWKVNGSNDFPMRFPIPSTPVLDGYIDGERVFSEKLELSRVSSANVVYDGNQLDIHPVLSGFFKTKSFSVNGLEVSSPISIKAQSVPNVISISPVYGDVKWDGLTVKVPVVPGVEISKNSLHILGKGFYLNGSPASGTLELPDGTSTLMWIYENGPMRFERIWRFYVDRTPPVINVSVEKRFGALILNIDSNEWSTFKVILGPVIMSGEGTEVSFRIRKILGRVIEIVATDRSGNTTKKEIEVEGVRE